MNQTLNKQSRTQSLPKLQKPPGLSTSKLFQTAQQLNQTKKLFLDRINAKQQQKNNEDNEKPLPSRSFLQFPKQQIQGGFTSFKTINRNQSEEMFQEMRNMRSRSTLLKPFVKAEILLNKAAHQRIMEVNQMRVQQEREYVARRIKQLTPTIMNKEVKIKEKFKNKVKNVKKITLQMNFKVYQQNLHCWKPYIDYDSLAVPIKQNIFFIGGRKQTPPVAYNIIENSWKELPMIPGMKCFGETDPSIIDNKKIICFGGYDYFQQGFSLITNTIKLIDITTQKYEQIEFQQTKTPCRAFHSQCIYGKFLIVSGGIDKNNKLFNNFMNYNYDKNYWNQLTIQKMPDKLKEGFAKHRTLPIFHVRANYSIYDNQPITAMDDSIKEEGIYIYGGEDSNADMMGTMYIMRLGQPSITIEQLQISGSPPIPRRNTRMVRHRQYLIVHGGRNDQMKPSVLNSMHFLNLKTLNWIKVGGEKPPYRYSHALTVVHDEIVILGGKGLDGLSKEVFVMPFQEAIQYV